MIRGKGQRAKDKWVEIVEEYCEYLEEKEDKEKKRADVNALGYEI